MGSDLPEIKLQRKQIEKGIKILDFLAENKVLASKSEARRAIVNKGIKLNDNILEDEKKFLR